MSHPTQSLSQLLMSFGPGAMMDLPTRSVVVAGLDHWDSGKAKFKTVEEPRLSSFLEFVLTQTGRWPHGKPVQLRTPPLAHENGRETDPAGVSVRVFPAWFTCDGFAENTEEGRRRRRLVRWRELDASDYKKYSREDGKKVDVAPIRFVGACKKGHLQDINWKWLLHRGKKCSEAMWIEEEGSSADPANIQIGCLCGRSLSLADAFKPGFLGACGGERPWLNSREDGCNEQLHFLSRSATNTYFPQTVTLISLPIHEDDLSEAVQKHWSSLQAATGPDFIGILRNVPEIGARLLGFSNEAVFDNVQRQRSALAQNTAQDPKVAEFELLASGKPVIGEDKTSQPLFAETLPQAAAADPLGLVNSIVAVHRLQAVTCLYGFTRLEPAPTMQDEHLEDVRIAAEGAPLSEQADWLPAMEQKGEGIFIKVRSEKVMAWTDRKEVKTRGERLREGAVRHEAQYGVKQPFPGLPYTLLHTLSHALMDEIALSCGYPISSLRERVYAIRGDLNSPDQFGILIYTASAGAQGTLGGLTKSAQRISELIEAVLDRLRLCSNDPVCAEHDPSVAGDERALLGAACHSCVLAPETSCEARNCFLDRALLVATIAESGAEISS